MGRWSSSAILLSILLLSGCASTTVSSNVTAFHEWPASLPDKVFTFERSREQDNDLEYRNYENLVRSELKRLGFTEAAASRSPRLQATLAYDIRGRDVRVIQAAVNEPYWFDSPLYGHRWRGRGYYGPFYDPFWPVAPRTDYVENTYQVYSRQLRVTIAERQSGRKLYDVTVDSEGASGTLATVMPYMVRSAFANFPGPSGVPRRIDLRMQD